MPNQRKKILGICDCGDIAKYRAFRLSLPNSPWVRACFKCIKLIELENREVQDKWVRESILTVTPGEVLYVV